MLGELAPGSAKFKLSSLLHNMVRYLPITMHMCHLLEVISTLHIIHNSM